MSNIKKTTIRFNMDNELHSKIWEKLQNRDLIQYPTYSKITICALSEFLSVQGVESEGGEKADKDKLISMSEITEVIDHAVERAVERVLPSFLAGYLTCEARYNPAGYDVSAPTVTHQEAADDEDEAADIDFGFMGL